MLYIGADHRGYELKEKAKLWLKEWNYECEDMGAHELNKDDDYPDFAKAVANKVAQNDAAPHRTGKPKKRRKNRRGKNRPKNRTIFMLVSVNFS